MKIDNWQLRIKSYIITFLIVFLVAGCSNNSYYEIKGHLAIVNTRIDAEYSLPVEDNKLEAIKDNNLKQSKEQSVDELIVSFKRIDFSKIEQLLKEYDLKIKDEIEELNIKKLKINYNINSEELLNKLNGEEIIKYVEVNRKVKMLEVPNDLKFYTKQWNYPAISLSQVWDINTGSKEVTVAVVDTGVDLDHPDLEEKLIQGVDIVADYEGYFSGADDRNGHGTHVAGIIAAVTNNKQGIAGVSWNVKIMPVRVLDSRGDGSFFDIAQGINWAVENEAQIINLSIGSVLPSRAVEEAIKKAYDRGIIVVAASGNGGSDYIADPEVMYPARYKETISVGAIDNHLNLASFSNYGKKIDFVAPGKDIYSTYLYGSYTSMSGTSMATPHLTGVAALLLAQGEVATPSEIKERLKRTAQDLGERGWDFKYGHGLINAHAALANIKLEDAFVFAGNLDDDTINLATGMVAATKEGAYSLKEEDLEGLNLYGWINCNNNDIIDEGDYFAQRENIVGSGVNIDLKLKLITDESVVYEINKDGE